MYFLAAISLLFELYSLTYPEYKDSKNTEEPVISYVALGLGGNGSFAENSEFAYEERYLSTKEEKAEFSKNYIKDNIGNFYDPQHLSRKMNYNFSSGFLGASDFVSYPETENNLFFDLFNAWGKYYWRTSQYCFLYINLLYVILLTGSVYGIFLCIRKKRIPFGILLGNTTFLGIFLFLMLWEANNRQLYNQMPILLFGAVSVIRNIRLRK